MNKVAVVFYSGTGNTEAMAEAVLSGALAAGADASLFLSQTFIPEKLDTYDRVAFGCPARGNEELEEEYFEPMFRSLEEMLKNKSVALFGSYGWGDGEWMITWQKRTLALGANLVDIPVIALEDPDDKAIEACKALGVALAQ